ncbi:MAG TPA: sugar ABC transporter permease [Anaerolineae bacterium]|nr:sugar ABC transporter permease [Anaerolineae bacterium]
MNWLPILMGWQAVITIGGVAGAGYVWTNGEMVAWLQVVVGLLFLLEAGLSGGAVWFLRQKIHRGRTLALLVNYLAFLVCFFALLQQLGFFTGLDALADTFGRGLPILLLGGFSYYVLGLQAERYAESKPGFERQIGRVQRWVMRVTIILFLLAVGIVQATLFVLTSLVGDGTALLLAGGALFFGVGFGMAWQRPVAAALGATNSDQEMISGWLFLSPNLLGFLFFFAGPLLLSLYVSFTNWDAFGTQDWVGLDNYQRILNLDVASLDNAEQLANEVLDVTVYAELTRFSIGDNHYVVGAEDKLFWLALRNTLFFVLMAVPLSVIPSLFLSNLLNSKLPGMKFFRAIYFLPSVAAVVGIALVWQWLFNATIGYINYFLSLLVDLYNMIGGNIDPELPRWLSDSSTALLAVVIVSAWQWLGFNTVLFLAGLQNIPKSLYEAATVDGATERQQFWRITLPLLAPTTFFVVTTTTIQAMQIFEQVFILIPTNPAGPNNSTLTMVLYLYQQGFQRFEQGYASAIAWVLFLMIFGATLFQFQRQRASSGNYEG